MGTPAAGEDNQAGEDTPAAWAGSQAEASIPAAWAGSQAGEDNRAAAGRTARAPRTRCCRARP